MGRHTILATVFVGATIAASSIAAADTVYTMSNSTFDNELIALSRNANGTLRTPLSYPTGGQGSGGVLGSGSISVSADHKTIVVVNAGSNSITMFRVEDGQPVFYDEEPSGGLVPTSVTQSGQFVYVLNQGNATVPGNVQEFVNYEGKLWSVPGAKWTLSTADAGAQQVGFTPSGAGLVVTEENTGLIDTIKLDYFRRPVSANSQPSAGVGPYGFAFDSLGRLYVTDANGGKANAGAVTSYRLDPQLNLNAITPPVATHWTAPCWDAVSPSGDFLFESDAHSGKITGFRISSSGNLTLLQANGLSANPGGATLDMVFSADGKYLYVLLANAAGVVEYQVAANGALTQIGKVGLPAGSAGLALG